MPVDLRIAERRVFAVDTIDHALTYINESIAEGIEKNTVTITYTRSVSHDVQEAFGVRAAFNSANLAKPAEVQQMVEAATRELGKVDILAGIQHTAPIENFPVIAGMP